MRNHSISLHDEGVMTIPILASPDNVTPYIDLRRRALRGITIFAPASLTGTITVEVTGNLDAELSSSVRWATLQSGGADIEVGASEAVPVDFVGYHAVRLASDSTEGSPREFIVSGVEEI